MLKKKSLYFVFFSLFLLGTKSLFANESPSEKTRWWIQGDYLLWTAKKASLSTPLVTTASLSDPLPGALGQPGTQVLLGDKKIDTHWQSGFMVASGLWIDTSEQISLEGNYFLLPKTSQKKSISTSGEIGSKNVAVPIYDVTGLWGLNGVAGETVFILPGPIFGPGFQGDFQVKTSSLLQGSELNTSLRLVGSSSFRLDFIGGFRFLQLQESLSFTGYTHAVPNSMESGFYNFKDSFKTNNHFFGAQGGIKAVYSTKMWRIIGFTKLAVGVMNQNVKIRGTSQTSNGNLFYLTKNTAKETLPGGIFAEPTNNGSHHRNVLGAAMEAGIKGFYRLTKHCDIGLGYNFLLTSPIRRPGDQINRKINPTRTALAEASRKTAGVGTSTPIPFGMSSPASLPAGPSDPKFKHRTTVYWVQGLTVDLNLHF